ncbi:MAG: M50 family metallopeptidase [Actinomycetota bacterium]
MGSVPSDDGVPEEAKHLQKIPKVDPDSPPPAEVEEESSVESTPPAVFAEDAGSSPPAVPGTSAGQPTENLIADDAPPPVGAGGDQVPRLAEGVEFLGEYEGSGFKEDRYLVRRSDGQIIQLTHLLHLVAESIDGKRSLQEIAERVSEGYGRTVSADNVATLLENNLRPDGVVVGADGSTPELVKPDPLLALKLKTTLVPEGAVNFIAGLLRPLFWPPVIVAVLVGLIALDVWYFGIHGIGGGLRDLLYQPLVVLMIYGLLILSVGWHELGHATACRYGGARPGKIGFGIYVVWPAFYTDVTDALKLGKGGRVRTDLGGVYFNAIFALAVGGAYALTGFEPILVLIVIQHMLMLYQFMPFLRLDGYHVVSDLTGIPDLFGRIKPTLKSMVPGQETSPKVTELKPWARAVVTIWVLTVIPVLLYLFGMMILSAPRILATGYDSFFVQWNKLQEALDGGQTAQATVNGLRMGMLVLPITGMGVTLARTSKRIAVGALNVTKERPLARGAVVLVGATAVAIGAYVLIPNGEYKPIQPNEDWTFSDGIEAASQLTTGRPSLPEESEEAFEGSGFVSEDGGTEPFEPAPGPTDDPAGEDTTDDPALDEEEPEEVEPTPEATEPTPEATPTV